MNIGKKMGVKERMSDNKKFTQEEIIQALEFDIKQYKRKHDYHYSLAQDYQARAEQVEKEIVRVKEKMK